MGGRDATLMMIRPASLRYQLILGRLRSSLLEVSSLYGYGIDINLFNGLIFLSTERRMGYRIEIRIGRGPHGWVRRFFPVEYSPPPPPGYVRQTGSWREISCVKCKAWRQVPDDWPFNMCQECKAKIDQKEADKKRELDEKISAEVSRRLGQEVRQSASPEASSHPTLERS